MNPGLTDSQVGITVTPKLPFFLKHCCMSYLEWEKFGQYRKGRIVNRTETEQGLYLQKANNNSSQHLLSICYMPNHAVFIK